MESWNGRHSKFQTRVQLVLYKNEFLTENRFDNELREMKISRGQKEGNL